MKKGRKVLLTVLGVLLLGTALGFSAFFIHQTFSRNQKPAPDPGTHPDSDPGTDTRADPDAGAL